MRLRVLSDLHCEFRPVVVPPAAADVVVLAGDIHQGVESVAWMREQFPEQPVVFVAGNHEFYHQTVPTALDELRAACQGTNIHFLENEAVELGGFTFLGCTLWTDFCLFGVERQVDAWAQAAAFLSDFRNIEVAPEGRRLRARDMVFWHEASRRWLEQTVACGDPRTTIIVTHHAPSVQSIPARLRGQWLTAAFASNLDALIEQSGVPLWIHGHTHHSTHYTIGQTHILANQRGYPKQLDPDFNLELTVEL
jgi:predicted phosphodiesterase